MKKRLLPILFIALLLALINPFPVAAADGIIYGDTIPAGMVVDHDIILIGKNVTIAGEVSGNVLIIGNQVAVNGKVDGSMVLIAQNAEISGEINSTIYALALTLNLSDAGQLGRDLYAATISLTSDQTSHLERHLYALGLDAGLNGQVGGELHTSLGPIQLYNGLMRLLGLEELTLQLHFDIPSQDVSPQGNLQTPVRHLRLQLMEPLPAFNWGSWALNLLRNWGTLFLLGLLILAVARKPFISAGQPLTVKPLHTLGIGLLVMVVSLNLFIVALLIFVIIFAIGLGFNFLGMWQLALALWVVSYALLATSVLALAYFFAFGAKLIVAYSFCYWVFEKLLKRKASWLGLVALLVGTILYTFLRAIPYAGWIVDILVTAAGMGSAWLAWRKNETGFPLLPIPVKNNLISPGKKRIVQSHNSRQIKNK